MDNERHDELDAVRELSLKLRNPVQTHNDINDAMRLVMEMFRERYINRINEALGHFMENSHKNPPKEAALLYALKPFLPDDRHDKIDKAAEIFMFMDAIHRLS